MAVVARSNPWARFKYKAFISYSHADTAFATALEEAIGAFRTPRALQGTWSPAGPVPRDLRPTFRDRTNLSASADLTDSIHQRLAESASLIVICSPASVRSAWVSQEVQAFRELGRSDRIFLIIASEAGAGPPQTFFPPSFDAGEPNAADARPASEGGEGFDNAVLRLVAGLLSIDPNEMSERQNARLVKRARNARRIAFATTGLAVLSLGAAAFALVQWNRANESLVVAQSTIDQVLAVIDDDRTETVWGFGKIEQELVERLVGLQQMLGDTSDAREGKYARALAQTRLASISRNRADADKTLELSRSAFETILPIGLLPDSTVQERTLTLRNAYMYMRDLGRYARYTDQEAVIASVQPVLENMETDIDDTRARRWISHIYDNIRYLHSSKFEYEEALEASDKSIAALKSSAEELDDPDYIRDISILYFNRAISLTKLDKSDEAAELEVETCNRVAEAFIKTPAHRGLMQSHLWCLDSKASAAYNAKDQEQLEKLTSEALRLIEIAEIFEPESATWKAAKATNLTRRGTSTADLRGELEPALAEFESAMDVWSQIYGEKPTAPMHFANLQWTVNSIVGVMQKMNETDKDNAQLQSSHVDHLLRVYYQIEGCARALGGDSDCSRAAMTAIVYASDMARKIDRSVDLVEPLEVTSALARQLETDTFYSTLSETFERACRLRQRYADALLKSGRPRDALVVAEEAVSDCRSFLEDRQYDLYLRSAVTGAMHTQALSLQAIGDSAAARAVYKACVEGGGRNCNDPYIQMLENGAGGSVDVEEANRVRGMKGFTNMKRFTVPVSAKGATLTHPFHVYVFERPEGWLYVGIEDQAVWLEENRGLIIPSDVRDSFVKLEKIAQENNVSFPDLAAYAVGAANEDP